MGNLNLGGMQDGPQLPAWGPAMRVSPWRRWRRLLSYRPEASCSSSTGRFRPGFPLFPFLLGLLPLLAGLSSEAAAQNWSSTTVTEGEAKDHHGHRHPCKLDRHANSYSFLWNSHCFQW